MTVTVSLKDFQAHENTSLTLQGGFSCLVGPTNSGKSSIVRALRWVFFDSLKGKGFIHKGKKSAQVDVEFDGVSIQRMKGSKENSYTVNGKTFSSIGTGAPTEVVSATGISSIVVDKDTSFELNVSSQMKYPFLVMETDSMKAKSLNVLSGGHVIDAGVRETNRKVRELEEKKKQAQEELEKSKTALSLLPDLTAREVALSKLSAEIEKLESVENTIVYVNEVVKNLNTIVSSRVKVDIIRSVLEEKLVDLAQAMARLEYVDTTLEIVYRAFKLHNDKSTLEMKHAELLNELSVVSKAYAELPDAPCGECGQVVTAETRKQHLHGMGV